MTHHEVSWKAALIDLDGTLYRGSQPVSGAAEFVARMRDRGIQPIFFTNNATRSPVGVVQHLDRFSIEAYPHEVCTAAQASADYLRRNTGDGYILTVGQEGLQEALRVDGLRILPIRHSRVHERLKEVTGAVIGLDPFVTYAELGLFCQKVAELGAFTLTNGDVRLPTENGFMPGNGAVGALVQTASRVTPYIAGKPNPDFARYALKRFEVELKDAVVIGDNLDTDIACGALCGIYTIQVRTGVGDIGAEFASRVVPDEIVGSVAELF